MIKYVPTAHELKIHKSINFNPTTTLYQEIRALEAIRSKEIVKYYGCVRDNARLGIVMEYCNRGNLKEFLMEKNKELNIDNFFDIIINLSNGLNAIHRSGFVHRDIKSMNILVNDSPIDKSNERNRYRYKIADFGTTKRKDEPMTDFILSYVYQPPEYFNKKKPIKSRNPNKNSLGTSSSLNTMNTSFNSMNTSFNSMNTSYDLTNTSKSTSTNSRSTNSGSTNSESTNSESTNSESKNTDIASKIDIYSFGIVMSEILNTILSGYYDVPYGKVGTNIFKLVEIKKIGAKPSINNCDVKCKKVHTAKYLYEKCTDIKPKNRPDAQTIGFYVNTALAIYRQG